MDFNKFLRQPTNIHALGAAAAGIGLALSQMPPFANPWLSGAVSLAAYVLVHLGIDDNSVQETEAKAITGDVVAASQGHAPSVSQVVSDAMQLMDALKTLQQPAPSKPAPLPGPGATNSLPAAALASKPPPSPQGTPTA